MPVLVVVLILVVVLATFLALLSPALDEAVEVGTTEIVADSEVIVNFSRSLDSQEMARAEAELQQIAGVAKVRPATTGDIANTREGYEVGSDISNVRTLVLTGTWSQESVVFSSRAVAGVDKATAGLGERVGWAVPLLQTVVPWLTGVLVLAGLVLVANVVFAAARSRREEAEIMRLVGASWLTTWSSLGAVVLVPVVLSIVMTTIAAALVWPSLLRLISPRAIETVPSSTVLGTGLRLTVVATAVSVGVSQLGLKASRRNS
jgi:cell division protein FtsX